MSQPQSLHNYTAHDIFLSHSGAQKGFVKDLYKELSRSFNTFLDSTDHSLPLGENFPKLIFRAAKDCKLAVVVLSEEFVCSRWPMLELSAFVAAKVNILPLFFKLSPADLKHEGNLKRWREAWNSYLEQDPKHRIDVAEWGLALRALCSRNGLIFDPTSEGEQAFLDKIVFRISEIVPRAIKFDTRHIHGKDRLCKVILDMFEMMESRKQGNEDDSTHDQGTQFKPSCVLGLYGMPGSGKSTLCKCLRDHFFPIYGAGKVLYLKLPTNSSPVDLIHIFKDLLCLTDFKGRINLDKVFELEQVENLLQIYGLWSCRVFLVIDNISEGSWRVVQRVLELGFGPGSKVILVARSRDVLRPILQSFENGSQCICGNMCIPTINETEAMEIILETTRAGTTAFDGYKIQETMTPRQKDSILGIVRMCRFRSHGDFLYLPLIMEIMGAMLMKYNESFEGWRSDMESFWTRVKTYKEDAVEELIGESFKMLRHENLQLLFLDVALFILPLWIQKDEASFCLSSMHGSTVSRMRMMMKDLERHSFLTVSEGGIIEVHDVYIEFAKSISKGPTGFLNWCWMNESHADATGLRRVTLKEAIQTTKSEHGQVRAMIQEVGPSCERLDLQGFSSLKAVGVRNSKSLKVLGLAGLRSLASLDIAQCAKFQGLECSDHDYGSLLNVKRLKIDLAKEERSKEVAHVQGEQPYLIYPIINLVQRVFAPNSFNIGYVRQMRNLQFVDIQNTGITRLEDMSRYWPQLQVLTVIEHNLEALELGNLPELKAFYFSDDCSPDSFLKPGLLQSLDLQFTRIQYESNEDKYKLSHRWRCKQGNRKFMLSGKDLLVGCPELKRVWMKCAFFQEGELGTLPPNLLCLRLHSLYTSTQLPDLSSSAHTLEWLDIQWCEKLSRVEFLVGFENLMNLVLAHCNNVVEVTGLEALPNLQTLHVSCFSNLQTLNVCGCSNLQTLNVDQCSNLQILNVYGCSNLQTLKVLWCSNLQSVNGFDNARMLQTLAVRACDELKEVSCLSGLANLETLGVTRCNLERFMATADLHDLKKLKRLHVSLNRQSGFSVGDFEHLQELRVFWRNRASGVSEGAGALEGLEKLVNLEELDLWGNEKLSISSLPMTAKLTSLIVDGNGHLANLDGIEHLVTLERLRLCGLQNLKSVQGLEFLINLKDLNLHGCSMLESLPSLHTLVEMHDLSIRRCAKLKAVEGCDQMKNLEYAYFDGCINLTVVPLASLNFLIRYPKLQWISFDGCAFARNVEMMLAWVADKEALYSLRQASLRALVWEYHQRERETYSEDKKQGVLHDHKVMKFFTQLKDDGYNSIERLERTIEKLLHILYEI